MELIVDKRKKQINERYNLGLGKWDMLLWQNLTMQVNNKAETANYLYANLDFELSRLYALAEHKNKFNINVVDNKDLDELFEVEVNVARSKGDMSSVMRLLKNEEERKRQLANEYAETQYMEYRHLVEQLQKSNYSDSFKYLILNEALTKTYKLDYSKGRPVLISNNRKLGQTTQNMMNLPSFVLDYIYQNVDNYTKFGDLYVDAQVEFNKHTVNVSRVTLDGVNTFGKGEWLKFPSRASDPANFFINVERLRSLATKTSWCTKNEAAMHLEQGDYYVFVDENNQPHIAVRMIGNNIEELRGIQGRNDEQELEPEYRDVAIDFLEHNKDLNYSKEWLEKEEWNRRLVKYTKLIETGKSDKIDVAQFWEDYNKGDYNVHGGVNTNLQILIAELNKDANLKERLVEHISKGKKYNGEEIYFGDVDVTNLAKNLKVIIGNVDLAHYTSSSGLNKLEEVYGSLNLSKSMIKELPNLRKVTGSVDFGDSEVEYLPNLENVGGDANFVGSKVKNLSKLKKIGGNAIFATKRLVSASEYKHKRFDFNIVGLSDFSDWGNSKIKKYIYYGCEVTDLSSLEYVGGSADLYDIKVKHLKSLRHVGGNLNLENSKVRDISNLEYVKLGLNLVNSGIKEVPKLKEVYEIYVGTGHNLDISGVNVNAVHKVVGSAVSIWHKIRNKFGKTENKTYIDRAKLKEMQDNNMISTLTKDEYMSECKSTFGRMSI